MNADVESGRELNEITGQLQLKILKSTSPITTTVAVPASIPYVNRVEDLPAVSPPSTFQRLVQSFRSLADDVKSWEFNPPAHVSVPRNVGEIVYVREPVLDVSRRHSSELNAETESLLSGNDKEEAPLEVRTREQEHQLILEAMQKRMVCPNFAVIRNSASTSPMLKDKGKMRGSSHMKLLPVDTSSEQLINRLEVAFREKKPPFAEWDSLLEKLSEIQKRQLSLHCAALELVLAKAAGPEMDENGNQFRENLNALHDMMDELSREVLIVQNIDPRDADEILPRRKSLDLPDLQTLHSKLFKSQLSNESAKDFQAFISPCLPSAPQSTSTVDKAIPILSSRSVLSKSPDPIRLGQTKDSGKGKVTSTAWEISEPPKYPPPPAPS